MENKRASAYLCRGILVKMIRLVFFSFAVLFFCSGGMPPEALAQSSIGVTNSVRIASSPRFPEPGESVTLSLNAYSLDTTGSSIRWYVDGVELANADNRRTLELTAGDLGDTTSVRADIRLRDGQRIPISHVITPTQLDVIIEADTLTPAFYEGRALPSAGSEVRVMAFLKTGSALPDNLSYRWELGNDVLYGGAVSGRNVAEFTASTLARDAVLTLDVLDSSSGRVVASESIVVPFVRPMLAFYPDNPLRGTTPLAITDSYQLLAEEIDIRAEPYFMDTAIFSVDPILQWQINNETVANPSTDPQMITLQRTGDTGRFNVGFQIRNRSQLLQGVEDSFVISF